MGCNCCRMLNSYMFKPQEPQTNGYVNEAHSYEHDRSKSPTVKISELRNEGHNVFQQDMFTGSHDLYNVPEKINDKTDEADLREPTSISSNAVLNINFTGEVKHDGHSFQPNDSVQTKSPSHQHGLHQNSNLKQNSDEPECIQHELCESIQENTSSLTESAIVEVISAKLKLEPSNRLSNSSDFNGLPGEENWAEDANTDPPDKSNHGSSTSLADKVPKGKSREPSLVALMIERNSARNSKKSVIITNGFQPEDDLDPDVAEALAALAAAIAGEEFEDN
ncbi:PDCD10 and GCKIII kinases-associated protein 1 isoform X2 [Mixophyes fleayi]|uniref:PDCD10 and GCKIII kinases-associated protein 1 isoform X2 n=1 Tax=Mixophyes fleayi TaxID=3061075 RepID=UPI003F4DA317